VELFIDYKVKNKLSYVFLFLVVGLIYLPNFQPYVLANESAPDIEEIEIIGPGKAHPNEEFSYTISFTNSGDGDAKNVEVIARLGEDIIYIDSDPQGNYDQEEHHVSWEYGTVQSSQTINIDLDVQVSPTANHYNSFCTDVLIIYEDILEEQYMNSNYISTMVINEPICNVICDVSNTADPGEDITYLIKIYNYGYPSATNVEVVNYLSDNSIYVSSTPTGTYDIIDHTVTWQISNIESEGIVNLELIVDTNSNIEAATNIDNLVEVTWMVPDEPEPAGPNSDSDSTTITGDWTIADEEIIERSDELIIITGSITIQNGGILLLNNVNLQLKKSGTADVGITVMTGGELTINEESSVSSYSEEDQYFFDISGSTIIMDSSISNLKGDNYNSGGLIINDGGLFSCSKSQITTSETVGITVGDGAIATIDNSYVTDHGGDGIHADGEITIENCIIESNEGAGVYFIEDESVSEIDITNVRIEDNSIGIFCECTESSTGERMNLEDVWVYNNRIDNMLLFNSEPYMRGKYCKINDNTILISSDTISPIPIPIKRDIQVKVLDSNYDPVIGTNVIVDDWEQEPACNQDTDSDGFVKNIEIVEFVGTSTEGTIATDYLTEDDLTIMPYLNSYIELIEGECQMKDGYYFNLIEETDWDYESHEISVDSQYTALEGFKKINPEGVIQASSSYNDNPAINAFDYETNTYWCADNSIGNYELLIDLTDIQPIKYINIYYQYVEEQSWFEGESYVIEGYNEGEDEWEEMVSVIDEENIQVHEFEAPLKYWDPEDSSDWVSKVRINIQDWIGTNDPGIQFIDIQDRDQDGLPNCHETSLSNTDYEVSDSDSDGMSDGYEENYGESNNPYSWFSTTSYNNKYAVIISVDDDYDCSPTTEEQWAMWNDCLLCYYMLKQRGFTDSNIHFLFDTGTGDSNNQWISWFPTYTIVDNSAQISSIKSTFNTLKTQITANDLLFVYIVTHGTNINGPTAPQPYEGEFQLDFTATPTTMQDDELATEIDKINKDARKVIVVNTCHSGCFIDDLSGDAKQKNRVILTSAPYDKQAKILRQKIGNTMYHTWTYYGLRFLGALNWKYPDGSNGWFFTGFGNWMGVQEDWNSDGEISIWEAHYWDERKDPKNYAMYDDDNNAFDSKDNNDGPGVHFIGTPNNFYNDGPLGKGTYLGPHQSIPPSYTLKIPPKYPINPFPFTQMLVHPIEWESD
jgi:uncharacterized repeat protein (TIGR01451 family)